MSATVVRYISRCKCGRKPEAIDLVGFSRRRIARDAEQTEYQEHDARAAMAAIPERYRGRCGCGRFRLVARVEGTYSADVVCNSQCTTAAGPKCSCSCGGANHGVEFVVRRISRDARGNQVSVLMSNERGII